jgi:hypothetical protein
MRIAEKIKAGAKSMVDRMSDGLKVVGSWVSPHKTAPRIIRKDPPRLVLAHVHDARLRGAAGVEAIDESPRCAMTRA